MSKLLRKFRRLGGLTFRFSPIRSYPESPHAAQYGAENRPKMLIYSPVNGALFRASCPTPPRAKKQVVIVGDIASTGCTIATAATQAKKAGSASVHAVVTHALFVKDAIKRIEAAGVDKIWSTDTIGHPSNLMRLADLLADAVRRSWATS